MALKLQCIHRHALQVPRNLAGTLVNCPVCGTLVSVPKISIPKRVNRMDVTPPPIASEAIPNNIQPARNAWIPDANKQATAVYLGLLVSAVGCFSAAPAAWEWMALSQLTEPKPVPAWVYITLLLSLILVAYGIYLAQVPDWSALWVATVALLATAACYAAMFASSWLGTNDSTLVRIFQYGDKLAGNRATMWCFVMLCISSVAAYFVGHSAMRWHNAYQLIKQIQNRNSSEA
jgi:hypothetical protein